MERDEYGSLENSLKTMEKNAEYAGQPEILVLVHATERPINCSLWRLRQRHCIWKFFYRPSIDIPYYPEERDDDEVK